MPWEITVLASGEVAEVPSAEYIALEVFDREFDEGCALTDMADEFLKYGCSSGVPEIDTFLRRMGLAA